MEELFCIGCGAQIQTPFKGYTGSKVHLYRTAVPYTVISAAPCMMEAEA